MAFTIKTEPCDDVFEKEVGNKFCDKFDEVSVGYDAEDQQLELAVVAGDPPPLINEKEIGHTNNDEFDDSNDNDDGPCELTMEDNSSLLGPLKSLSNSITDSPPPSLKPVIPIPNGTTPYSELPFNADYIRNFSSKIPSKGVNGSISQINSMTSPIAASIANLSSGLLVNNKASKDNGCDQKRNVDDLFDELSLVKSALCVLLESQLGIIKYLNAENDLRHIGTQAKYYLSKIKNKGIKHLSSTPSLNNNLQNINMDEPTTEIANTQQNISRKLIKSQRTSFIAVSPTPSSTGISSSSSSTLSNSTLSAARRFKRIPLSSSSLEASSSTSKPVVPNLISALKSGGLIPTPTSNTFKTGSLDIMKDDRSSNILKSTKIASATATAVTATRILQFRNGVPILNHEPLVSNDLTLDNLSPPPPLLAQNNEVYQEAKRRKTIYDDLPPLQRETI